MYVCLCNGHRDHELTKLARNGVSCAKTAYAQLGGPPQCGACLDTAQRIIDDARADDSSDLRNRAA